jgi:hypothetical protein
MKGVDLLIMGKCLPWESNVWFPRYKHLKFDFLMYMRSMYGRVLKEAKLDFAF